jgi:hypothetical protein
MELLRIEIPKFAKEVTVSQARRANYYHLGEKIPKKYDNEDYGYIVKGKYRILANVKQKPPVLVIKNPNTAGTPRKETISGNDIWNTMRVGNYTEIIKLSVQKYFWDVIKHFELDTLDLHDKFPLRVHLIFHTYKEPQDVDNLDLIYRKAFLDAIQDRPEHMVYDIGPRLIRKDDAKTVKSLYTDHHDCMPDEEKLIITISLCDNKVIDYNNLPIWKINIMEMNLKK